MTDKEIIQALKAMIREYGKDDFLDVSVPDIHIPLGLRIIRNKLCWDFGESLESETYGPFFWEKIYQYATDAVKRLKDKKGGE